MTILTLNPDQAPEAIVAAALAAAAPASAAAARPVILLDGGSGAGKTSLAAAIAQLWPSTQPELQVVSLDDVYTGWHGLAAASEAVPRILAPGESGYRRWNWGTANPADWVQTDPARPILVEGCGALTRKSAPLATLRVWVELPEPARKVRALAREGGAFDPYWDLWAAQERQHWAANRPWDLADLIVRP